MDILTKINTLPNEIQNLIFYFVIQTEADLIRNIDWVQEYKNTFLKMNFYNLNKTVGIQKKNIFGKQLHYPLPVIYTFEKGQPIILKQIGKNTLQSIGFDNTGFCQYIDKKVLIDLCVANGIKKFYKNNRIDMIKKLMKI